MLASSLILAALAGFAMANPLPAAYPVAEPEAEARPVINITEIARSLGVDEHLYKREQRLWAVWSSASFETIAPPVDGGQNTIVHEAGFNIINPARNSVYHTAACQDYNMCVAYKGGRVSAVRGIPCLGGQMVFGCVADANLGLPQRCAVWRDDKSAAHLLDKRKAGDKYFNNFLSTGYKGTCIVSWINGGGRTCPKNAAQTKSPTCRVSDNYGVP